MAADLPSKLSREEVDSLMEQIRTGRQDPDFRAEIDREFDRSSGEALGVKRILSRGKLSGKKSALVDKHVDKYMAALKIEGERPDVRLADNHSVTSFVGDRVPEGHHKGEPMYGTIREKDAYGSAYEYVTAQHLLPWIEQHFRYGGDRGGPYQAAIVAYVRVLPPDTKIILDWH